MGDLLFDAILEEVKVRLAKTENETVGGVCDSGWNQYQAGVRIESRCAGFLCAQGGDRCNANQEEVKPHDRLIVADLEGSGAVGTIDIDCHPMLQ
jgi:hypothetical protein